METWRRIAEFLSYEISTTGLVRNARRILNISKTGQVQLSGTAGRHQWIYIRKVSVLYQQTYNRPMPPRAFPFNGHWRPPAEHLNYRYRKL